MDKWCCLESARFIFISVHYFIHHVVDLCYFNLPSLTNTRSLCHKWTMLVDSVPLWLSSSVMRSPVNSSGNERWQLTLRAQSQFSPFSPALLKLLVCVITESNIVTPVLYFVLTWEWMCNANNMINVVLEQLWGLVSMVYPTTFTCNTTYFPHQCNYQNVPHMEFMFTVYVIHLQCQGCLTCSHPLTGSTFPYTSYPTQSASSCHHYQSHFPFSMGGRFQRQGWKL